MLNKFIFVFLLTILFFSFACQRNANPNAAAEGAKRYELNGTVVSVDKQARKAKIEHDEIKGYMPAMTMDFPIKEDWVLRELRPNDKVAADLVVERDANYYLENFKIMATGRDAAGNSQPFTTAGADLIGKEVLPFPLTNQDGKRFKLTDYKGKNLILTFIFTRCPDPNMCVVMSLNFSDLENKIRQNPELAESTRLLSVTFDPEYDTPAILRSYAVGYQGKDAPHDFKIWNLATGSPQEIKDVEDFFGAAATRGEENRLIHNLRTALIDKDGKIVKIYAGNGWKPADVLADLQSLTNNK
jgi:protein SCO1/2